MSKNILIVGCGQLGSRHLQAAASIEGIGRISVVDPHLEALALGQARLKEITASSGVKVTWHTALEEVAQGVDLCILATQAPGRFALLQAIFSKTHCRQFLIEKIVAQSVGEYGQIMRLATAQQLAVWVNCKTRAYQVHRTIRSRIQGPVVFSAVGGNHGLATNGIHNLDLFCFYDNSLLGLDTCHIDLQLYATKRQGNFDLSGTIAASTSKGSRFLLSFAGDHMAPELITITAATGRFMVDHTHKCAWESYPQSNWQWQPLAIDENWAVSHMSKVLISDILAKGKCLLPTLEDCYPAHQLILEALRPSFNALLKTQDLACPVT